MKKKGILLIAVILLSTAGLAQAQEDKLGVTLDVTYASRYIWRGFDIYVQDDGAFQPSIDIDLYGTGFGLSVFWSMAPGGEHENREEIDLTLYYGDSLFEGETYATDYRVGWVYYGFPDEPRSGSKTAAAARVADMQEFFATFSWPNICPVGIVPSYTVLTMWPSEGNSAAHKNHGYAHVFGLGYDLTLPGFLPGTTEQVVHLSLDVVYNDGVSPPVLVNANSGTVKHDWSHAVFGVSTGFALTDNLTLTPGFYFQSSWEDTVNPSDEYWTSVSMTYKF